MSYRKTDLKATHHALKILKDGFRKAQAAHDARTLDNEEFTAQIRAKYPEGSYTEGYYKSVIYPKLRSEVDAHNKKNQQKFIDDMGQTSREMLEAVRTLKEGKDFRTQALDFSDPTLINALRMLDTYGKDMPLSDQRNLCLSFSGDMPALRAIENGMKKNGMRYSEIAHRMQSAIDESFLDEAEHVICGMIPDISPSPSFEKGKSFMLWFNREIDEKAEIYGLDLSVDPYREAIRRDAELTGGGWEEQQRQSNAHKLVKQWESDLQEMESRGDYEQANRSAKQIYDVLAEDGIKMRE